MSGAKGAQFSRRLFSPRGTRGGRGRDCGG